MPDYTRLRVANNYTDATLNEQLAFGITQFLDWGILNIGGFQNVNRPSVNLWGGTQHKLRLVNNPNYTEGQVWEGFRKNWVWESGLDYSIQPIQISGVWVDGVFHDENSAGFEHIINYPYGQVIFNSPISTSSDVQINFSFKRVHIQYEPEEDWYNRLMFETTKFNNTDFTVVDSGIWHELAQTRIQLPAIILEIGGGDTPVGYELGNDNQYLYRDVYFNIISETKSERDKLVDLIQYQNHRQINLVDFNKIAVQQKFPLDINGSIVPSAMIYPDLVDPNNNLVWRSTYITNSQPLRAGQVNRGLHMGIVKSSFEVIL